SYWTALAAIMRGWALAVQGQREEGITQMRQSLAAWHATGSEIGWAHYLAMLAAAYEQVGQPAEGLTLVAEALEAVNNTGERFYEAELYRLKGTLTLQSQSPELGFEVEEEVEACFHQAIEIARKQQAKSLELRAVVSLARLWQQQGKQQEAHNMLAE